MRTAQERRERSVERRVQEDFVGELEARRQALTDRVIGTLDVYTMRHVVPVARVGKATAAQHRARVEETAADDLAVFGPRRPTGDRLMEEHHALAIGEQAMH